MDDIGFGRLIRMARIRRSWTQQMLATRAGVTRTVVSHVERGNVGALRLDDVRAIAASVEIRVEVKPRARAIDIDRLTNAGHAAMAEHVIGSLSRMPGWMVRPEVSFSEFGERGAIDLLCWHTTAGAVLVVEIKTELIDIGELLATLDRKHRLARLIARRVGWSATSVSSCLLIAESTTNRRRVREHATLLRAALPGDAQALRSWLRKPVGELRAIRFVPDVRPGHARSGFAGTTRVRLARRPARSRSSRSACGAGALPIRPVSADTALHPT